MYPIKPHFDQVLPYLESQLKQQEPSSELHNQLQKAIRILKQLAQSPIKPERMNIQKLPQDQGSDGYYTWYYLIDEAATQNIPDWGYLKKDGKEISIGCFDAILTDGKREE